MSATRSPATSQLSQEPRWKREIDDLLARRKNPERASLAETHQLLDIVFGARRTQMPWLETGLPVQEQSAAIEYYVTLAAQAGVAIAGGGGVRETAPAGRPGPRGDG